jgi:hypothetical protein
MKYLDRLEQIKTLPFDTETITFNHSELILYVYRPSKLSNRFKEYDLKKNFQIWLRDGQREFKPNHLRVFIDLYLRVRSRKDLKRKLAMLFDGIFYGEDPDELLKSLEDEEFEHFLNSLAITVELSQLFLIEQEYGYHRESKYSPSTLFYQGWIRQIIDTEKEIDNLIMSIARGQPPAVKYTSYDDKNHKSYTDPRQKLWWLQK